MDGAKVSIPCEVMKRGFAEHGYDERHEKHADADTLYFLRQHQEDSISLGQSLFHFYSSRGLPSDISSFDQFSGPQSLNPFPREESGAMIRQQESQEIDEAKEARGEISSSGLHHVEIQAVLLN